jgi:calcineurin-like phosphoesterase family protein
MSMIYFTADTHYMHKNIIKYCNRPFASVESMNDILVDNINKVVRKEDVLYHLGDWSFGYAREFRDRLNCDNIILIYGNHDKEIRKSRDLQNMFTSIYDSYHEININGQDITLCHYAMKVWNKSHRGAWHLYGHSHGSLPDDSNSLSFDCGVDCWEFYPIDMDEISKVMKNKKFVSVDHHGVNI